MSGNHVPELQDPPAGAAMAPDDLAHALRSGKGGGELSLRGCALAGADLHGANLSGLDFTGADLTGSDLTGASLAGATLTGASLGHACLQGAELLGADLSGADLSDVDGRNAGFGGADASGASFFNANLENASFSRGSVRGADLRASTLRGARLRETDLRDAQLERADLRGADLGSSPISGADFTDARLQGTMLRNVVGYENARWIGVDVTGTDFTGAYRVRRTILDENFLHEFRTSGRLNGALYWLWWATSDCGRSLLRWSGFTAALALAFAATYARVGVDLGAHPTPLSHLYFSVVTLTTLGYGDVVPATALAQGVAMVEVVVGYVMLGGLISILSGKMARRAD